MKRGVTLCVFLSVLLFSSILSLKINAQETASEEKPNSASAETASFSSKDIQEDDAIYFKVEAFDVSENPPLFPYFEIYSHESTEKDRIARTSASEASLNTESVSEPEDYEFSIPKTQSAVLSIDVLTDYGNDLLTPGKTFPADVFLKQSDTKTVQELEISQGNTISFRLVEEKKHKKVFQIVGFSIANISKSAMKKLVEDSRTEIQVCCAGETILKHKMPSGRLKNTGLEINDFLVEQELMEQIEIEFQNSWGKLASFLIPTEKLIKKLKETIDLHPGNPTSWKMTFKDPAGKTCVLKFQGVQRYYRIKSIRIPEGAPIRSEVRPILATKDPNLRVFVMENGKFCGVNSNYARSKAPRSWQNDFAADKRNLFLIKEGCTHIYSIHAEDTSPLLDSPIVVEFVDLTEDSFKSEIRQKLPSMMSEERASRITFEEVKEKR